MNGSAIQTKPRIHNFVRCSRAIGSREPGTKNNATIPKKDRPNGTKAAGASRIMMSINKKDDPQVSAIPSASAHSVKPNFIFVSAEGEMPECDCFMGIHYSRP